MDSMNRTTKKYGRWYLSRDEEIVDTVIVNISDLIEKNMNVYVGLNSHIPLLAVLLAKFLHKRDFNFFNVAEGYNPDLSGYRLTPSSGDPEIAEMGTVFTSLDSFDLAQKGEMDLMFFGAVQVDEEGNLNLSVIGNYDKPKVRLSGGAAAAFLSQLVKRLIIWNLKQSKLSIVKRVDFITSSIKRANNEVFLFTDLSIMKFDRKYGRWRLISLHPWVNIEKFKESCGADVIVEEYSTSRVPTKEEIDFINRIDPYRLRLSVLY